MAEQIVSANFATILRSYSLKVQSAVFNYYDFCAYLKKYSEEHVEEVADLVKYLGNAEDTIKAELDILIQNHQAAIVGNSQNKKFIVCPAYLSIQYAQVYKSISKNQTIPFPKFTEIPKIIPKTLIPKEAAADILTKLFNNQDLKSTTTHCINFPHEVAPILFPECVPISVITDIAISKLRLYLKKDDHHDYFLKKLRSTNHGKEITVQNFFRDFINNQKVVSDYLNNSIEYFYLLSQLCYFVRVDVSKVKDMTAEDENILQSVSITEIEMSFFKTKMQKNEVKAAALKELDNNFKQMPFFFSLDSVYKFTDTHGSLLYGQYSEEDLREYLTAKTKPSSEGEMPELIVLDTENGTKYFIHKDNVFALILRLSNEANTIIDRELTDEWTGKVLNFQKITEASSEKLFEEKIRQKLSEKSPILYALLNSSFLPVLHYEVMDNTNEADLRLFSNGHLLPYRTILLLDSKSIMANIKASLPFWYTAPIISAIAAFFHRNKKEKPQVKQTTNKNITEIRGSKERELVTASLLLQQELVPEGSTIDRELDSYENQWNKLISEKVHKQLTEDVNSLIRDYLRKNSKHLNGASITSKRLDELASAIAKYPTLQKINEHQALKMYTKLYMLRMLSNFK